MADNTKAEGLHMCIVHRIYKVFAILFTAECSVAGLQRPGTASDVSQRDVSDQSSAIFVRQKSRQRLHAAEHS